MRRRASPSPTTKRLNWIVASTMLTRRCTTSSSSRPHHQPGARLNSSACPPTTTNTWWSLATIEARCDPARAVASFSMLRLHRRDRPLAALLSRKPTCSRYCVGLFRPSSRSCFSCHVPCYGLPSRSGSSPVNFCGYRQMLVTDDSSAQPRLAVQHHPTERTPTNAIERKSHHLHIGPRGPHHQQTASAVT